MEGVFVSGARNELSDFEFAGPRPTSQTIPESEYPSGGVGIQASHGFGVSGHETVLRDAVSTLRTWSGRDRALPTNDILASRTFMSSVPVEIREYNERTNTPPD